MTTWIGAPARVWRLKMGAAPVWGLFAKALKPLKDDGQDAEYVAACLGNFIDSCQAPYTPNLFRFAATIKMWERPVAKKADKFPWPEGDARWTDPQYTEEAIQHYSKGPS